MRLQDCGKGLVNIDSAYPLWDTRVYLCLSLTFYSEVARSIIVPDTAWIVEYKFIVLHLMESLYKLTYQYIDTKASNIIIIIKLTRLTLLQH